MADEPDVPVDEAAEAQAARDAAAARVQRRPPQEQAQPAQPSGFDPKAFLQEHEPKPFDPAAFIKQHEPQRSWSSVPLEAVKNIPSSAVEFGKAVVQPILHPIETAQNLGALGGGVLQHLGLMKGDEYKGQASAVGKYLMDRYTTEAGIKEALATDPVGIAADLSMILSGGGTAAARLPGIAGKAGQVAATAGRLVDPLTPAIGAAKLAGQGVGRIGAEAAGISTHVGSEPYIQAAKAGYEGGQGAQAFREHITGRAPMAEPVAEAQKAVEGLRKKRGTDYRAAQAQVALDKTILDFNKVDQALVDSTTVQTFNGVPIDSGRVQKTRSEIAQAIQTWKMYPPDQFHTPAGLDALKKQIDGIRQSTDWGTPERVVADGAVRSLRNTVIDQMGAIPGSQTYVKMLKGYNEASDQLRAIEKELSLPGDKAKLNIDTALRKLQSTLRNNVNTSFGRRQELAQFLVDNGAPHLMAKLAGQALNPLAPRGLGRFAVDVTGKMGALMFAGGALHIPGAVAAAVPSVLASSPRVMGEATYWGGRGAGLANRAGRAAGRYVPRGTAYQAGRASNVVEEGDDNKPNVVVIGRKHGGAVRPLGREGIQARNKERAAKARERSSLARGAAQAKRKVKYAEGGFVPTPRPRPAWQQPRVWQPEDELQEGQHDFTARGSTEGYYSQRGQPLGSLEHPDVSYFRHNMPNVSPSVPGNERLGELTPLERRLNLNPLEQDYRRSFGAPATKDEPEDKPYPVHADGGQVAYPIGSPEFKEEVARGLAKNQDTIARAQEFYPRVPLNDKAWEGFLNDAPQSLNIEDRRGLRGAFRKAEGGPIRMAHHEQSETIQNDKGEWVNVYGKKTPRAGQQLPDTPSYPRVEDAVDAARRRSEEHGREHPDHEGFAGGGRVNDDSSKVSKKSVNYSKGMPKAHCSICTHWRHGKCTEVQGKIWHSMWCELFKRAQKYQEGGHVAEEEDPLEAEKRRRNVPGGLSATAGPTVTSTTPVQDIPAPKVNSQGETFPTYALKEIGKSLISLPERATKESGDLQRRGEYAGSHEDLPSFGGSGGMPVGTEAALSLYGANAPFPKPGIGIFGGRGGKTANLEKLQQAEKMQGEGVPHADVRKETGWEFGAEGQPKYEMTDENTYIRPKALAQQPQPRGTTTLEEFIHHPEYFQDYPHLANLPVEFDIRPGVKERGGIAIGPNDKPVKIIVQAPDVATARSVVLHEMQHGVQQAEGFASGANPSDLPINPHQLTYLTKEAAQAQGYDWYKLTPDIQRQMEAEMRHMMYRAYAGETEARNVQTRADLGYKDRQDVPSWITEDVDRMDQLLPRGPGDVAGAHGNPFKDPKVYKSEQAPPKHALKNMPIPLGQHPTTNPRKILKETKAGGYSVHTPTGVRPTEGLMMGIYRNTDPRNLVVEGTPSLADVRKHGERNIQALQKPERHYGTWKDPESGITYFDVSQRFPTPSIRKATKFGERTGQISGYNIGKGESFPVGNWEKFIRDPEFHARITEQAQRGGDYLSQFPTREWWDMRGGPFENVYGTQNMPQTAGFTASTAPNTKPIENLQHASEYMRRHIRGEPVVQPEWRAPEGLMSLAPGRKMPLEQSRIANLRKSAAGNLSELSRRKVRSEALAMMGDPRAVVLDRHWARIGEAPERGIYTDVQEGVISSVPRKGRLSPYEIMENEVAMVADRLGRDPRDFSADAWTGIRETIRTTSELYGQKFRGAAIQGESKSYADHFVDLIQRKAGHMRMSVNELERRLRAGDVSLLSQMLAMPTIASAYSYWLMDQVQGQEQTAPASSAGNRAKPVTL